MLPASTLSAIEKLDWTNLNVFSQGAEPWLNEIWKQGLIEDALTDLLSQRSNVPLGGPNPAASSYKIVLNEKGFSLNLELFPSGYREEPRSYDWHLAALLITGVIELDYFDRVGSDAQSAPIGIGKPFLTKQLTAGSSFCIRKGVVHRLFVPQEAVLFSLRDEKQFAQV